MSDEKSSISVSLIVYSILIAIGSAVVTNQQEILSWLLAVTPDKFDPVVQYTWGALLAAIAIFIPSPIKKQDAYYK